MLKCSACGSNVNESACSSCRRFTIRAYKCQVCGAKVWNPYYRGR